MFQDIQGLIDLALTKYDADRTGKCDFALESAGGSVITSMCSKTYAPSQASINLFGIPLWIINSSPRSIIQVSRLHITIVHVHVTPL